MFFILAARYLITVSSLTDFPRSRKRWNYQMCCSYSHFSCISFTRHKISSRVENYLQATYTAPIHSDSPNVNAPAGAAVMFSHGTPISKEGKSTPVDHSGATWNQEKACEFIVFSVVPFYYFLLTIPERHTR